MTWNSLKRARNSEGATHDPWGLWSAILAVLLSSLGVSPAAASHGDGAGVAKDERIRTIALLQEDAQQSNVRDYASETSGPADSIENGQDQPEVLSADGKPERRITKLIPDIRVLHGSLPTRIDLNGMFERTGVAEGSGPLKFTVIHNKQEQIARAAIEEKHLILKWGKVGKNEITLRVHNPETQEIIDSRFRVEVWQPDYWKLALVVVGGLGLFLLGMKNMSDGLQAIAGVGLRRMISAITDNRLMATGVGTVVTMLIQSSSITTVMVVGFVNSGLMSLSQACGVIMGANIGTTVTGWILTLKIGTYGLPIMGLAALAYLFSKRDRLRYVATAFLGLGMLFFGLELMKNGFSIIKDLPAFEAWFEAFSADTYWGVLKCALAGCVLTFLVQSSSATLGITISLTLTGVIGFETAAALVLGENIGTTITAWLASFGTTTNAKRAAYFHIAFNMIGVAWITAVFLPVCLPLVEWIVGTVPDAESGTQVISDATKGIALTHTLFNVTNMLLFLPFVRLCAKMLERVVPHKVPREKPHLTSLDVRMLETSSIAIEQSRIEVLRMALGCRKLMTWIREILPQEVPDEKLVQKAFHREEVLDAVENEIVAFMANLLPRDIPHDVADEARCQLRLADEYESISDYFINILKSHLKLKQLGLRFADADCQKLLGLHDMVGNHLELVTQAYEQRQPEIITKARSQGRAITHQIKELRSQFLTKMSDRKHVPEIVVGYQAQLNFYRRVREHVLNIAEAIGGEK